jgi:hypothetical protein
LAYADVKKLKRSEISRGIDGEFWIFTNRQKTDARSRIPLLPQAVEIMEKYRGYPACVNSGLVLPVLSNQKMNAYLQEIGDACEIPKHLTFHIARHTFATTVTLSNGVPIGEQDVRTPEPENHGTLCQSAGWQDQQRHADFEKEVWFCRKRQFGAQLGCIRTLLLIFRGYH